MHPWLFHDIPTYGICLLTGLLLAWLLARSLAKRTKLDPSRIDLLMPIITAAGIGGALLFGKLTDAVAPTAQHGTVLLGSLLLATAAGILYALLSKIPLGLLGDITAAPIAIGIACGRIGCFFAGCCFGKPCPSIPGLHFPAHSFASESQLASGFVIPEDPATVGVYPVQLYESALCLLLALILVRQFKHRKISGELFLLLALGYSLIRFPLEFLRADNPAIFLHLTFSQLLTPLIFLLALTTFLLRRRYADHLRLRLPIST